MSTGLPINQFSQLHGFTVHSLKSSINLACFVRHVCCATAQIVECFVSWAEHNSQTGATVYRSCNDLRKNRSWFLESESWRLAHLWRHCSSSENAKGVTENKNTTSLVWIADSVWPYKDSVHHNNSLDCCYGSATMVKYAVKNVLKYL